MANEYAHIYRELYSIENSFLNKCFYCGCEATHVDFAPPLKHANFYLKSGYSADFYKIPACYECHDFLQNQINGLLSERFDMVKDCLAKKYKKPISIFESWNQDEMNELGCDLKKSIEAGMKLGEEAYERYKFKGFEFEVDGEEVDQLYIIQDEFTVFGEVFRRFKDALDFASKSYRIPKATLRDLLADNDNSFDEAINSYHREMAEREQERDLKNKCRKFAEEHKQNINFVIKTIKLYMSKDEEMTMNEALEKLFEERIKK